uniref:Periplasmic heavy metal sensor n=1 Tax=uncultured Armatimonadetes bacterium TaxID=157466 RepID=A0A6J4JKI4_9BACT|nr:hypothetical protein AVDCRST_MAG63-3519 [uncultured Armatimonadetes bacterium]
MTLMTKRLVAAAAVTLGVLPSALAQPAGGAGQQRPTPEQMRQMQQARAAQLKAAKEKLYKDLGITGDQKEKLEAIEKKYTALQQKLVREMEVLGMKAQSEQMAVLTAAQKDKLKKMMASRPGAR